MQIQVIYVFRHAEKADTADNPSLNEQGQLRAQQLARALQHADIQSIFSTRYARTQQTAAPLATALGLAVETYQAGDADAIIATVKKLRHPTLIIGHSNTVPNIVRAAGGEAPDLTEKDYGDLFQVIMTEQGVITNRFVID
ncbi:histidine phosphatase family protein [Pseudidiomarina aestuarii]|uniref:Histidine phosphatase family protein n=2 Tax=Pseudidiomarina aestuarii TaxID=624146 RepID=A0A7Z6ZW17_9GAMM|nr:histidine phosphatase family protein [Pseudidiomarina aestuarii]